MMNETLKIQNAIKKHEGELVEDAQQLVDDSNIFNKSADFEESQLRNVLEVANQTECVEVVENFILYQIGRDSSGKKWKYGGFGESLVDKIKSGRVYGISDKIVKELKLQDSKVDEVWLKLTRLYLGYLNRYFIYRKKT
ncbi:hypothetical protein H8E77_35220 [bacterium]|nr:hypothetical protein [bacterium]